MARVRSKFFVVSFVLRITTDHESKIKNIHLLFLYTYIDVRR